MNETTPIWTAILDDRYDVRVTRGETPHQGLLVVRDSFTDRVLLSEPVLLSYAAMFGPDIDDVRAWQERAIAIVDATKNGRGDG